MFTFSLHDLLAKNTGERADHPALVFQDVELSYRDLSLQVSAVAAWLYRNGVRRGDRVGIHLPKSIEEVVASFAAARIGAVFVNVNYQWTTRQLDFIAQDCDIRILVTDARRARKLLLGGVVERLVRLVVCGSAPEHDKTASWDELLKTPGLDVPGPIDADLAALLYTSGSTGRPKGVMITHQNLVMGARCVASYLGNDPADRILSLLPLSFDYGLNQLTTAFLVGATVVLQRTPIPAAIAETVVTKRVTGLPLVAPSWVQVVRYLLEASEQISTLRYLTNTGGKIPKRILEAMPELFPGANVFLMYGLTESFRSTYLPPDRFMEKLGSIGKAVPNVEIFVVDPERGVCGPGEEGELIHRGALISMGYWRNPQATAEKIKVNPHLRPTIGDEKVVHSGDLVRVDQDGYLWFVGRADSMIKCSGFRLSPTEIEEILCLHSQVEEAVAFGVDDEDLGQIVYAAVSGAVSLDADELLGYCRRNMPNYMVPNRIHTWSGEMPRTGNGKIDRRKVIDMLQEGSAA